MQVVRAGLVCCAVSLAACQGREASSPPPPAASPSTAEPALPPGHPPVGAGQTSASLPPGHPPVDAAAAGAQAVGEAVTGRVEIADAMKAKLSERDVLFIIARDAASGSIVAVRREEGVRFPHAFSISGADAMTQGSAFTGPFDLTARLSKSGDAMPSKGDVEGTLKGVEAGASDVVIRLDSARQ